jgi:hypothetical protein
MAVTSSSPSPSPSGGDLAALQQLLAAGGSSSAGSGLVYMGEYSKYKAPKGASAQSRKNIGELGTLEAGRGHKGSIWVSGDQASQDFYTWTTKKQADFVSQGILSGMLKTGDGPLEGATLWKKLVKEAANYGAVGKKVSPYDLMASYVQASGRRQRLDVGAGAWQINTQTGERRYVGPARTWATARRSRPTRART